MKIERQIKLIITCKRKIDVYSALNFLNYKTPFLKPKVLQVLTNYATIELRGNKYKIPRYEYLKELKAKQTKKLLYWMENDDIRTVHHLSPKN